jgi:flagellar biosynthesis/type III secretory pathway protein FliH
MRCVRISLLACGFAVLVLGFQADRWPQIASVAEAQEAETPATEAAAAKVRKKPRGRLPYYYSRVVDEKQRELIYAVQGKYAAQISQLQQQIDQLVASRMTEVEQVLTEEQKSRVVQFVAEALQRRNAAKAKALEAKATADVAPK